MHPSISVAQSQQHQQLQASWLCIDVRRATNTNDLCRHSVSARGNQIHGRCRLCRHVSRLGTKTTNWLAAEGQDRPKRCEDVVCFFASKLSCSWFLRRYVVFWKTCVYGLYSADRRRLLVTSTSLWLLVSWWILSPVSTVQTVLLKTHRTRFYTSESRRTPQDGVVGVGVMECLAVLQSRWLDFSQVSKTSTNLNGMNLL